MTQVTTIDYVFIFLIDTCAIPFSLSNQGDFIWEVFYDTNIMQ